VARRRKSPHGSLTLARRLVGVLCLVVKVPVLPMFHRGQYLSCGGCIALQLIGDHHKGMPIVKAENLSWPRTSVGSDRSLLIWTVTDCPSPSSGRRRFTKSMPNDLWRLRPLNNSSLKHTTRWQPRSKVVLPNTRGGEGAGPARSHFLCSSPPLPTAQGPQHKSSRDSTLLNTPWSQIETTSRRALIQVLKLTRISRASTPGSSQ
jgi:hypothetical protein